MCEKKSVTDNTAQKQSDRTDEGTIERLDHVTTYVEDVGISSQAEASPQAALMSATDPYPPGEVSQALTRSYQIAQFTWSTSDVFDTEKLVLVFPYELFQKQFIADKIKYYQFFRAKVKVTFRVSTTKFEYGALLIAHLPFYLHTAGFNWRLADCFHASQCNPEILSAQQGSTVEVLMPWCNPNAYGEIDSSEPEIGTLVVRVLHPLASASADPPPSVSVTVFAQFVDPELAGYAPDAVGPTPLDMAESKRMHKERDDAKGYEFIPNKDVRARRSATADAFEAQSKAPPKKTGGQTVQKEAEKKDEKGVLTGVAEAVQSIAPVLAPLPVIGEIAEVAGTAASFLSPIFKFFGLNKPTSMQTTQATFNRYDPGFTYGRGLDYPIKLALDPEYQVATQRGIIGEDDPQPKLLDIMRVPGLLSVGQFNNTVEPGDVIKEIPVMPTWCETITQIALEDWFAPSYLQYYSNFAHFWRGSIKYKIRFVTSSFVTTRVRISHLLAPLTSAVDAVSGDLVSKVITVTGDTEVDVLVPYLSHFLYKSTQSIGDSPFITANPFSEFYTNGVLQITMLDPIVSVDTSVNPYVHFSIWLAAGEDFRLMKWGGSPITPTAYWCKPLSDVMKNVRSKKQKREETFEAQSSIARSFQKSFEGLVPSRQVLEAALINGEDAGTLNTLLHRYVARRGADTPPIGPTLWMPWFPEPATSKAYDHLLLVLPYQFYRGSMRVTELVGTTSVIFNSGFFQRSWDSYSDGFTATAPVASIRAEIPWMDPRLFVETAPTIDTLTPGSIYWSRGGSTVVLTSVGDDFSVGSLASCPWYHVAPPPLNQLKGGKKRLLKAIAREGKQ